MFDALDSIWFAGSPLAQTGGFWLPESAAADPATDRVFYLILVICSLLFLLVLKQANAGGVRHGYSVEMSDDTISGQR